MQFVNADGSVEYTEYAMQYAGDSQEGVVYELTMDSGSFEFYFSDYVGVQFKLTDINGETVYDTETVSVVIGLDGIELPAWGYMNTVYTTQSEYTVSGYTVPGRTVRITLGATEKEAVASATGVFSATFTGLAEGSFIFHSAFQHYLTRVRISRIVSLVDKYFYSHKTYLLCLLVYAEEGSYVPVGS